MTTTFKPYPKYKTSGVEWLGDIPEHWEVMPCRSVVVERDRRNTDGGVDAYLSLMANRGIIPYEEKGDIGNKKPEDLTKCKLVMKGDFVINSMNYYIGSYGVSPYDGVCSPVYVVMTPLPSVDHRYAFRIFENKQFQQLAQTFGNGILEHRRSIGWDILKSMRVAVPLVEEQTTIANFLDSETAKIDETIKELKTSIELLNEEKISLITEYVTGKINAEKTTPRHWEKKQLRHFAEVLRGKFTHRPRNDPAFYGGDFPFIQTGDITGTSKYITGFKQTLNHRGIAVSKEFPKGTLVMAIAANIGDVAILDFPAYFPDSIVGLVPRSGVHLMFLYYLMISLKSIMVGTATVSTQMNLNVDQISAVSTYCPTLQEQIEIAQILDTETKRILSLISEKESLIETLKKYRTSLIHEAVTGKIDLRNA